MNSFLKSARHRLSDLFPPLVKRKIRNIADGKFRELRRLRKLPRRTPTETDLLGPPTQVIDVASFLSSYKPIFEDEIYAFETKREAPRIIDGGANIGLATLYWKRRFPEAQITAFEPGPQSFQALKKNVDSHDLKGVRLLQKGLWKCDGTIDFVMDGADGGHFDQFPAEHETDKQEVPVIRLAPYLDERIDMLKLDIEGAELEVLIDSQEYLDRVQNLFVEYHSYEEREQVLDKIINLIHNSGFRYHLKPEITAEQPFVDINPYNGMDNNINIFAYR